MATEGKISLEELNRRLADASLPESDLQKYFLVDEARSGAFDPVLALNPATVEIAAGPAARSRSAALLNSANYLSRTRRRIAFNGRISGGTYKGPVLVSEGDSWFQYPFRLEDVIDDLMQDYAVFSLDAAGDTLSNMLRQAEYMGAIENTGASIFLFSGGGNDVVAGGNLAAHLFDFDPTRSAAAHLRPTFNTLLDESIGLYSQLVRQVAKAFPDVQIVCHGYDYTIPADGPWLGKPMASRGIVDQDLQRSIAHVMIDRFNERLRLLQHTSARVNYIDCRNTVAEDEWFDELHPTDQGFEKVAKKFKTAIEKLSARPRDVDHKADTTRAARSKAAVARAEPSPRKEAGISPSARAKDGPTGRSLHIGLNAVDPRHYAGWDGQLAACEFDAADMEEIASSLGYETKLLLTKQASRDAVIGEIKKAAAELAEGDIFFLSVSCHGGQMPDFNGDEEDGADETWCMFDGQIIDDELYELWSSFKAGVRVLVVSDSCHSGSITRAVVAERLQDAGATKVQASVRAMPLNVAARTFRQNRDFYTELGSSTKTTEAQRVTRATDSPISCTVRLISGCQDNQESLDGIGNGAFTGALIHVWNHGRFKRNYEAFHKAIAKELPPTQSPNFWSVGPRNPVFDAQTPFAI
ncbi:peptidase C14, caspase catalytic subunit p20 [Rhizobium ruizarguesonis]|uniref:caspase family protein n=1 Tax=Rhizobium ruizarguesonis TaxID=2081791 RepID=UPI001031DAEC|nr:caspase family protein [Rhizobium ruizarguesonis]TBE49908.1 peptidase C14, caspase catalytic subunit p20 [Rhizobium ruizarguesonis]